MPAGKPKMLARGLSTGTRRDAKQGDFIMRRLISAISAVFLVSGALLNAADAAEVAIDPDRMLVVNGERTFIRGLYENPGDDAVLDEAARAGINLIDCSPDRAALDRLHARGIFAWCDTGGAIFAAADPVASEAGLRKLVAAAADHPAFLTWEVPDEILWNTWLGIKNNFTTTEEQAVQFRAATAAESESLAQGYALMKRLDPHHPIWMNHAAGNSVALLAEYARGADIIACDLYPLMPYPTGGLDISRSMLGSIGLTADRMQASAPGKPVWMVLQGMAWGDFENPVFTLQPRPSQYPTYEESRFMAYNSIVHGARGVLYWGTYIGGPAHPVWKNVLDTVRDLTKNAALLAAPDAPLHPAIETRYFGLLPWPEGRANIAVRALGKSLGTKTHWIIVNECPFPVGYTLSGLESLEGQTYRPDDSGPATNVQGGALTGILPRYGVRILYAD